MTINTVDKRLLIIFYRNPILGRVKTRLAATVGEDRALVIYRKLVRKTQDETYRLSVDKRVCYSEGIEDSDVWDNGNFQKQVQAPGDLGQKMWQAVQQGLQDGYASVCLIGSDCWELTAAVLEEAFCVLDKQDVVLGPATDGGYYLIGMNKDFPEVFANKKWSTDSVFLETLQDISNKGWTVGLLPMLSDVDVAEDLPDALRE